MTTVVIQSIHTFLKISQIVKNIKEKTWRMDQQSITGLQPINQIGSNDYSAIAKTVRDNFKEYVNQDGAVSWQWERI